MKKLLLMAVAAASASMHSIPANAWDGDVIGYILHIDVTGGSNYGFRVRLQGSSAVCNSKDWGYLNAQDDNYQAYVSVLLSAFIAERSVEIFSNADSSGMCRIGYVVMKSH